MISKVRMFGSCLLALGLASADGAESLDFRVSWGLIHVADATIEMSERESRLDLETRGVARWLYPVHYQMYALMDEAGDRSLRYERKSSEGRGGRHQRDVVVTYDWDQKVATYSDFGEPREPLSLNGSVVDPLSAVLQVSRMELEPGKVVVLPVSDGRDLKQYRLAIGEPESVGVVSGEFRAFPIVLSTGELGGVFKDDEDSLTVWVAEQEPHLLVRVESQVAVGSFVIQLDNEIAHPSFLDGREATQRRRGRR